MSSDITTEKGFETQLENTVRLVNEVLGQILSRQDFIGKELEESVRYALEGPGKRIRSCVVMWCCEIVSRGTAPCTNSQTADSSIYQTSG